MNIPEGVIVKDGNEILDKSEIFTYKNGSYSAFSNLFRFKLLFLKGGYWADLDLINIRRLDFKEDYVFVTEPTTNYNDQIITTCLIKMPKGSKIAEDCVNQCYKYKSDILNNKIIWGLGPKVLSNCVKDNKLEKYVKNWNLVCSCHCNDTASLFNPNYIKEYKPNYIKEYKPENYIIDDYLKINNELYCVHLWNKVISDFNLIKYKDNYRKSLFNFLMIN